MGVPTKLVSTALALTIQDWSELSLGEDPVTAATDDRDLAVERVTALLVMRVVACVAPSGTFPDWGTSQMCRMILQREKSWPEAVGDKVITQVHNYVKRILKGYKDVDYHSFEHAYHVILSTNKLMDMMVSSVTPSGKKISKPATTFGLRSDPLSLLALVFAALVHDVEHQGIPNRQLATENDRLAILYNDQSIAENWSLYVAFSELLQDDFSELRTLLFDQATAGSEKYKAFRKTVVNLVLQTDIASPDRTQISKSKWKEAFGDTHEAVEAKIRSHMRRMSMQGKDINVASQRTAPRRLTGESNYSEITFTPSAEGVTSNPGGSSAVNGLVAHDDESPSGTPEASFHDDAEGDDRVVHTPADQGTGNMRDSVRSSGGSNSAKLSLTDLLSTTSHSVRAKFERRQSNASHVSGRYRQRLGILRTIDLSGQSLETYSRHESTAFSSHSSVVFTVADMEADEPDELKAIVVLETIMTAADVAHNLQSWDHMVKWSGRLYKELRKAFVDGRGPDVSANWFENQIGFLEAYLLPLARRLEDMGVFDAEVSAQFAKMVENNRDRWLTEGYDISQNTIEDGLKKYPLPE
jgi:hypothetical protein